MVKMVTGFEESFSAHAKTVPTPNEDYGQLYEALTHDLQVAENVFARATKRSLKHLLKDTPLVLQESSESRTERPLWIAEKSVTLNIDPTNKADWVEVLLKLTDTLVRDILDSMTQEGDAVVLIDPIKTQIMQVGAHEFTFRVKQKWAYRKVDNG